jgi:geranylgeranyl diphosphate synthase type II
MHRKDEETLTANMSQCLSEKRSLVEERLRFHLGRETGCPAALTEAMRYSLLGPGKRLRPLLVLLSAEACGRGPGYDPWPAACAVEMMHVSSLIHDDLPAMDDDDLRRGQPTCHRQFDEATAILAGDAFLVMAFELLAQSYPSATAAACCLDLARAVGRSGMIGGQCDDLALERAPRCVRTLEHLEHLHSRKTGDLIRAACRLGARAAFAPEGAAPPPVVLEALDTYGRSLGLLFQITDDLLDVEGHAGKTGKRVGKDATRNKLTYPGLLGTAESRLHASETARLAVEALAPFRPGAGLLRDLVSLVLHRDR